MKPRSKKVRSAYIRHRRSAIERGIEFDFSFEEWVGWWEDNLGPDWLWKRGLFRNQYVMARYYDDGPYAPHNVKCITAGANSSERARNKTMR